MKKISLLLLIFFFHSCSSTTPSGAQKIDLDDEDLAWLENSDFIPAAEVPYRAERDFFTGPVANHDALSKESLARVDERSLGSLQKSDADPVAKALAFCYAGNYTQANSIIDESFDEYKSHPSYWNAIGTCYFLQGQISKSLLYYNKSRSIDENYAPAINNIGVIYQRQGFSQRALKSFEQASEKNNFSSTPAFNLAQLYLQNGFASKAREILMGLHSANDDDVDVLNGLAMSFLLEGDSRRAVSFFGRIPRSEHRQAHIGLNFAIALKIVGRDKDAETIFKQVSRDNLGALRDYYFDVEKFIRG